MSLLLDLRYSMRKTKRSFGFVLAVTCILALGIGANTAVFSVVDAQQLDILVLIVGQGLKPTLVGLGIGLAIALGTMRLLRSQLFGVGIADPEVYGLVALLLAFVTALASGLSAIRAAKIDAIEALKSE